jgi:hypothetical protein
MKFYTPHHITCIIITIMLAFGVSSCEKALDPGPSKTLLNNANVYTSDGAAQSVLSGLYMRMASTTTFYNGSADLSLMLGLSADELISPSTSNLANGTAFANAYTSINAPGFFAEFYREIFVCNLAIKGLINSNTLTATVKQQLLAELKFIRAFNYFYATNLYGNVPLTLTDDPAFNNVIARSSQADVYAQILKDLSEAQADLPDGRYVNGAGATVTDRVRPNKQVATAMLARVYLYLQDWKNAEVQASAVIASSNYILEPTLNNVFLKASKEAIWQLQSVSTTYTNTVDGFYLIPTSNSFVTSGQLPLSNNVTGSFETGDKRFANWVGQYQLTATTPATVYNYAYKYKVSSINGTTPVTEYPMVMRLAELYLIRAEAKARQSNLTGAESDLFAIRTRAGLGHIVVTDQPAMLAAIEKERKTELFAEWGHRWFDLKRTGRLTTVMSVVTPTKGGVWADYKQLFPITANDIANDPNLTQTPGYN